MCTFKTDAVNRERLERHMHQTVSDMKKKKSRGRRSRFVAPEQVRPGHASVMSYMTSLVFKQNDPARANRDVLNDTSARMLALYRRNASPEDDLLPSNDDLTLQRAHKDFVQALALIKTCNELTNGDKASMRKSERLTAEYLGAHKAPFAWTSSRSFYSGPVAPVYFTNIPREHCVMLGWRAVMKALRTAVTVFNPCQDYRAIYQYPDGEYDKRRQASMRLLVYAATVLDNFVLSLIKQQCGDVGAQSTTLAAAALPEMRVGVIGAFVKMCRAMMSGNVVNHFNYNAIVTDAELNYAAMRHKSRVYGHADAIVEEEKQLCYNLINKAFSDDSANLCQEMRCFAFMLYYEALKQLTEHVWHDALYDSMRCVRESGVYRRKKARPYAAYASMMHRCAHEWFCESVEPPSEKDPYRAPGHVNEHVCATYRRGIPARALRNFLAGSAVHAEVMMNAHTLAFIDIEGPSALSAIMRASVLASKVEILLAPVYGRRRAAFEIIAWVLQDMDMRTEFCYPIVKYFKTCNEAYQFGKQHTLLPEFARARFGHVLKRNLHRALLDERSERDSDDGRTYSDDEAERYESYADAYDDTMASKDVGATQISLSAVSQKASQALFSRLKSAVMRKSSDSDEDDEQQNATAASYQSVQSTARPARVVPVTDRDIETWYTINGALLAYRNKYDDNADVPANEPCLRGTAHCFVHVPPTQRLPSTVIEVGNDTLRLISQDVSDVNEHYLRYC